MNDTNELDEARKTNQRLNRRCQIAESTLAKMTKINDGYVKEMESTLSRLRRYVQGWGTEYRGLRRIQNQTGWNEIDILKGRIVELGRQLATERKERFCHLNYKETLDKVQQIVHLMRMDKAGDDEKLIEIQELIRGALDV